jgi:hypothetical protein
MKTILSLLLLLRCCTLGFGQSIVNGDLNGPVSSLVPPPGWQAVPHTDSNCKAAEDFMATPDLTSLIGPDSSSGIMGNPFSGSTFVSGLDASWEAVITSYWHEGIQQTVTGFSPDTTYTISFYQAVVKQDQSPASFQVLDSSGSWSVFLDNNLISTTSVSISSLPFNSTNLFWDLRTIQFVATSTSHTIKFLPTDDDTISASSDSNGGLRMGIDNISMSAATGIYDEMKIVTISAFPNPTTGSINIDLGESLSNVKATLTNGLGQVILTECYTSTNFINIDIDAPKGIYFLQIESNGESKTIKVLKE